VSGLVEGWANLLLGARDGGRGHVEGARAGARSNAGRGAAIFRLKREEEEISSFFILFSSSCCIS
jgi:hypothetical protein